ncbi:hypothetical protein [Pararhodonellum marinum]|uniref:hypothetical protein n=1 Tax=Pararhodonellum marinum TaxID=2755358 RepID=UPI0018903763|nr:hypothetical protein [Pararhodonellum marinum]
MKLKSFVLFLFCFVWIGAQQVWAQCAMCRATVENNVSNGDTSVASGLNLGILYLLVMPYLLAAVIGFLWYRNSRKKKPFSISLDQK